MPIILARGVVRPHKRDAFMAALPACVAEPSVIELAEVSKIGPL